MHFDELLRAGMLPIKTVGDPGTHGATVAGTQGIGVKTPKAAAVAEATVGLAGQLHIPKVGILTIGLLSIILAAGTLLHIVQFVGNTIRLVGAAPKEHCNIAPITTSCPIFSLL